MNDTFTIIRTWFNTSVELRQLANRYGWRAVCEEIVRFLNALITHLNADTLPLIGRTHIHNWIRAFGQYATTFQTKPRERSLNPYVAEAEDEQWCRLVDVIKREIGSFILMIPHHNLPKWHAFCRSYR